MNRREMERKRRELDKKKREKLILEQREEKARRIREQNKVKNAWDKKKNNNRLVYKDTEKHDFQERLMRRIHRQVKIEEKEINILKENIIKEYGLEPTIGYYYYLWNAIDYVGRQRVKESFESISGQGDEVIIGDYCSTDGTRELAEEYGIKVINVEKTKGIKLHETKIGNKVIHESESNFLVDLNINTVYPNNMDEFYKPWINKNNVREKLLVGRGIFIRGDGRKQRIMSASCLFYKPFLKELRGFDERAYYGFGATHYAYCLLVDVLKLKLDNRPLDMIHQYHIDFKSKRLREVFHLKDQKKQIEDAIELIEPILDGFYKDIDTAIKNVKNSYW